MSEYQKFVKKHLGNLKNHNMTQQDKMRTCAHLWRQSGKGLSMGGGTTKKPLNMTHYMKEGGMLKGGKINKKAKKDKIDLIMLNTKKTKRGGNIQLDNGMMLHPSMLGGAWYDSLWKGITMPFKAIGKVAKTLGPIASIAKMVI